MTVNIEERYRAGVGKAYPVRQPSSSDDYLQSVLRAERFIAQHAHHTAEGIYWDSYHTTDPNNVDSSFYGGGAGIAYFYLKLYQVTHEQQYADIVHQATRYVVAHWRETLAYANPILPQFAQGLYAGVGGIGLTLADIYEYFHDETAEQGIREIVDYYRDTAKETSSGLEWTGSVALILDGGIILFLQRVQELFPEWPLQSLIVQAGAAYLDKGKPTANGGLIFDGFDGLTDYSAPNFEFGTAGAGYVLLKLYEFTQDDKYLQGAYAAAEYLKQLRYPQKKGYLIPYHLNDDGTPVTDGNGNPIFYLSLCHGPSATAKFYFEFYKVTSETDNLEIIDNLFDGLESLGAPEYQSAGLWNCVTLCCGNAGLLHAFIGLYHATGNIRWKNLAQRTAATLLGWEEQLEGDASDWPIAWERIKPDDFSRRLGYFDGAAGIALSLLEIYLTEQGNYQWDRLIVDPFPTTAYGD